jgi:ribosomal protein S18 acetylase RimI-like enzyme
MGIGRPWKSIPPISRTLCPVRVRGSHRAKPHLRKLPRVSVRAATRLVDEDTGERVGSAYWYRVPSYEEAELAELFIDPRFQRRGYGEAAVRLAEEEMARQGAKTMFIIDTTPAGEGLYRKLGYRWGRAKGTNKNALVKEL